MLIPRSRFRFGAVAILLALLLSSAFAGDARTDSTPDKKAVKEIPSAFSDSPTDVAKLRALEQRVEKMLDKAKAATVGVRMGAAQGSGVIVTEDGYVLTAGHVSAKPGIDCTLVMPNGKVLKAKTLGRNGSIDSGMIKIVDPGKYPFAEMGRSASLKKGQWVVAIGHPGGFRPNRTPVVRVGRILYADPSLIRTDCTLVGGDSGGPLFDLDGKVIGIHSRIGGGSITENVHVPIDTFRLTWDRLASSQNWGGQIGQQTLVKSAGGKIVFEKKSKISFGDPRDRLLEQSHFKAFPFDVKAGSTYTIDLSSKAFDAYLRLEDARKKVLAEDDDGAARNSTDARIVYRANRDETLTIIATSFGPDQSGRFELTVREAAVKDSFASGDIDVFRTVKIPRQVVGQILDKFTTAGVALHVTAVVLDAGGKPLASKATTVSWKDGKETLKTNDDGIVRWKILKDRVKGLTLKLPEGARALLRLTDPTGNPVGPFFTPETDPSVVKVKSAGGPIVFEVADKLTNSDKADPGKKGAFVKTHEFKMLAGETYTIDLESEEFDGFLRLEDSEGDKIKEDDDSAGFLNSRIIFTPKEDDVYKLAVTSADPGQFGLYRLTIRKAVAEKK
ncbi:MAG TPA: serine protease [Gemmataceae bacterium]|nr:serine protease [Gemmataceae bacterium]